MNNEIPQAAEVKPVMPAGLTPKQNDEALKVFVNAWKPTGCTIRAGRVMRQHLASKGLELTLIETGPAALPFGGAGRGDKQ
jgi:hypothetical protein